jgi:predicted small lipoprotein YifL
MTLVVLNQSALSRRLSAIVAGICLLGLTACAGSGPLRLPPGSSSSQVIQALGPPTGVHELQQPLADPSYLQVDTSGKATRRLEYRGGTFSTSTYMFDFDAGDRLLASAQVLGESRFNAIRSGMDQQQVLRALGRPSTIWHLGFQRQNVWAYRYENPFCQWFQVGMGYDGKVVDTAYGPDPRCEDLFDGKL